jgi:hypothetical protein
VQVIIIRTVLDGQVVDANISNDDLKITDEMRKMLDDAGFYITIHNCDLVRDDKKLMGKILNILNFELMDESDFVADETVNITVE